MVFRTTAGNIEAPDVQVAAVRQQAEYDAEQVAIFLRNCCAIPSSGKGTAPVPLGFALELGAALRVLEWRYNGTLERLGDDLTPLLQCLAEFIVKADDGAGQWRTTDIAPLYRLVFKQWIENFAWSGRSDVGVDCLLESKRKELSDQEIEAIARILWDLRQGQPELGNGKEIRA